ncbi:Bax inhibitor-1/YccA family protein, partial [Mycolicibacterium elephantis]
SVGGVGMISQAIVGTIGVFFGMLVVYKTGAIRVTPKFTRMIVAGLFGVLALMLLNLVLAMFGVGGGAGLGLRDGGMLAIGFSLLCIGLAAFSFLIDFDAADQMVRAGAPEKAAWGIALGLTVTLVWLYIEILRLLSYFNSE